ncbi:hypothetical protein AVEN_248681-1 [Araneus ventricosus]|uniref:Uncharacterized protein n=1 Tax=Araneus ventricosus TaxID=182803 RepID=A0A4Y2BZT0_ARAVE|nr:hypothetical protein AVEN_248681-1 [Araneus ventricosus]
MGCTNPQEEANLANIKPRLVEQTEQRPDIFPVAKKEGAENREKLEPRPRGINHEWFVALVVTEKKRLIFNGCRSFRLSWEPDRGDIWEDLLQGGRRGSCDDSVQKENHSRHYTVVSALNNEGMGISEIRAQEDSTRV